MAVHVRQRGYRQEVVQLVGAWQPIRSRAPFDAVVNVCRELDSYHLSKDFVAHHPSMGVAISWDPWIGDHGVNLDLECATYNARTGRTGYVGKGSRRIFDDAIMHDGESDGLGSGWDEVIWMELDRLPRETQSIVFALKARHGFIGDAVNGRLHLLSSASQEIQQWSLKDDPGADVKKSEMVLGFYRGPGGDWQATRHQTAPHSWRSLHDMETAVVLPVLRCMLVDGTPCALAGCAAPRSPRGHGPVDLPDVVKMRHVCVDVSWDTKEDVDVSALMFDHSGRFLDAVYFGNTRALGVQHTGDVLDGRQVVGVDEQIVIDFPAIPSEVSEIVILVNMFNGGTFYKVRDLGCKVVIEGKELTSVYSTKPEDPNSTGCMMGRFSRASNRRTWAFTPMKQYCRGRVYKESLPDVELAVFGSARTTAPRSPKTHGVREYEYGTAQEMAR